MVTERENQTSMTLQTDLKLNSVKSSYKTKTIIRFPGGLPYEKDGVPVGNLLKEPFRGNKRTPDYGCGTFEGLSPTKSTF